jgi:hypothetical protein
MCLALQKKAAPSQDRQFQPKATGPDLDQVVNDGISAAYRRRSDYNQERAFIVGLSARDMAIQGEPLRMALCWRLELPARR